MNNITDGQQVALRNLLDGCAGEKLTHEMRMYVIGGLLMREVHGSLSIQDWQRIRNEAFPRWMFRDWETISPDFKANVIALVNAYREEVVGQRRMF